jgi:hypothetical protein
MPVGGAGPVERHPTRNGSPRRCPSGHHPETGDFDRAEPRISSGFDAPGAHTRHGPDCSPGPWTGPGSSLGTRLAVSGGPPPSMGGPLAVGRIDGSAGRWHINERPYRRMRRCASIRDRSSRFPRSRMQLSGICLDGHRRGEALRQGFGTTRERSWRQGLGTSRSSPAQRRTTESFPQRSSERDRSPGSTPYPA